MFFLILHTISSILSLITSLSFASIVDENESGKYIEACELFNDGKIIEAKTIFEKICLKNEVLNSYIDECAATDLAACLEAMGEKVKAFIIYQKAYMDCKKLKCKKLIKTKLHQLEAEIEKKPFINGFDILFFNEDGLILCAPSSMIFLYLFSELAKQSFQDIYIDKSGMAFVDTQKRLTTQEKTTLMEILKHHLLVKDAFENGRKPLEKYNLKLLEDRLSNDVKLLMYSGYGANQLFEPKEGFKRKTLFEKNHLDLTENNESFLTTEEGIQIGNYGNEIINKEIFKRISINESSKFLMSPAGFIVSRDSSSLSKSIEELFEKCLTESISSTMKKWAIPMLEILFGDPDEFWKNADLQFQTHFVALNARKQFFK